MVYRGTIRNGVVELDDGGALPDGTLVRVEPIEMPVGAKPRERSLFEFGRTAAHTGQADLATNIDHYLYGHPKVRENGKR